MDFLKNSMKYVLGGWPLPKDFAEGITHYVV